MECPACNEDFEEDLLFGTDTECPKCHAIIHTDWDYVGEDYDIAQWPTGYRAKEE